MLNREYKRMLIELIKDGIMTFEILSNELDNEIKSVLKVSDIEAIKDFVLNNFKLGYIKTSDGQLSSDNLTYDNRKLLIVDVEKVFEDEILNEFDEYEDLKAWFNSRKEDILLMKDKTLFMSSIDNEEYIESSKIIIFHESKIYNAIDMMAGAIYPGQESLLTEIQENVLLTHLNAILAEIDSLPKEYHYAKDLYSFKKYYQVSKNCNSRLFKGYNRNEPCPCGSGKKFKKCCMS